MPIDTWNVRRKLQVGNFEPCFVSCLHPATKQTLSPYNRSHYFFFFLTPFAHPLLCQGQETKRVNLQ